MPLDPNILMQVGRGVTELDGVGTIYDNQLKRAQRDEMVDTARNKNQQNTAMNRAYQESVGPDGKFDQGMLLSNLAKYGAGSAVPGAQKVQQDYQRLNIDGRKADSDISAKSVETDSKLQEILYKGLKHTDDTIAGLLSKPDVNERDVYSEMGRLVRSGAFDIQAKHSGKTSDDYAREMLSTMPVGNPQALRGWLTQSAMRNADASKRLELTLPKYDEQDRGGAINQGTINQMTGVRTDGAGPTNNVAKTASPESMLSANTSMRVAGMVDNRQREMNDINREAANSQIVEGPNGFQVVNKGTTLARPVADISGQPVLGKGSNAAENAAMARNMLGQIKYGKELLGEGPTGSPIGAIFDKAIGAVGLSTTGGDKATQLTTLGGWMTSNVPRMQGPQGVQDVILYQQMAGTIGDASMPTNRRLAALETVERLMKKYEGVPGTQPARVVSPPPVAPGVGGGLAGPRVPAPYRGATPIGGRPGELPDINSFFTNGGR
jgi:hypothetical protein